jgi:three-Cys-motif partner protein
MKAAYNTTDAVVGPWAKEKLDVVARYLDFYTKVLKNQPWQTIYVDAYAGGGRSVVRGMVPSDRSARGFFQIDKDEAEFISGSPRVALDISNPFDWYIFIERDFKRVAELRDLQGRYGSSRRVDIRHEEVASGIEWFLRQKITKRTHRGIAFLDPFGVGLDWSIVQALADTRLFEVVINFPLNMAIQRMLPNSGEVQEGCGNRLDSYFGTPRWYEEVYETRQGFFSIFLEKRRNYRKRLLELYHRRLRDAFGFTAQPRLIRNTKGTPLYYLLWAGPHEKGLQGADYILRMGERLPDDRREAGDGHH